MIFIFGVVDLGYVTDKIRYHSFYELGRRSELKVLHHKNNCFLYKLNLFDEKGIDQDSSYIFMIC